MSTWAHFSSFWLYACIFLGLYMVSIVYLCCLLIYVNMCVRVYRGGEPQENNQTCWPLSLCCSHETWQSHYVFCCLELTQSERVNSLNAQDSHPLIKGQALLLSGFAILVLFKLAWTIVNRLLQWLDLLQLSWADYYLLYSFFIMTTYQFKRHQVALTEGMRQKYFLSLIHA